MKMPLDPMIMFVTGILIGFIGCLIPMIIINRARNKTIYEITKNQIGGDIRSFQERCSAAETELSRLRSDSQSYQLQLNEKSSDVAALKNQCQMNENQIHYFKNEIALRDQKINEQIITLSQLKCTLSESQAQLDSGRIHADEKIKLLSDARDQLKNEFKNLANGIFDEKNKTFAEQNRSNLDLILSPLKDQLGDFRRKVEEVYVNESKDRHALAEHIKILTDLNRQVSNDTVNLTRALKGENKTQGNWGEMILERALELSGLKKGSEYDTQTSYIDTDGNRLIPDVVVHLPDGKDIIIDSKVTLIAYERAVSAVDDLIRDEAVCAHVLAVQTHINQLNSKSYESIDKIKTLDYVLMFMPIEAAFIAAIRKDPSLFEYAFRKKIIIVSPSTLLVTLRTIQNIWQSEYQNRNTQLIVQKAADLYDKFTGFTETLLNVKKEIGSASESCEKAIKQLCAGNGNVVRRIEEFRKMGVAPKKRLPEELVEVEYEMVRSEIE
jgi:DNA recombination protein RmuC